MSPVIVLWELQDHLICGDEEGRLVVIHKQRRGQDELVLSRRLRRIRCSAASLEFQLQPAPDQHLAIPIHNAFVEGYIVRCAWSPELQLWIIAGEPRRLPSANN